jgi:hypothetical protein
MTATSGSLPLSNVPSNADPTEHLAAQAVADGMAASARHRAYAEADLHTASSQAGHTAAESPEADNLDGTDWS